MFSCIFILWSFGYSISLHFHWHKTPIFILTSPLLMNLSSCTPPLPPLCCSSLLPHLLPTCWKASVSGWELIKQHHPKAVWFHQTWLLVHRCRCGLCERRERKKNAFVARLNVASYQPVHHNAWCSRISDADAACWVDAFLPCTHRYSMFVTDRFKARKLSGWRYRTAVFHWLTEDKSDAFGQSRQSDSADHDSHNQALIALIVLL